MYPRKGSCPIGADRSLGKGCLGNTGNSEDDHCCTTDFLHDGSGHRNQASEIDLLGRMMSMQKAHQLCHDRRDVYGSCAAIPGTLVHSILSPCGKLLKSGLVMVPARLFAALKPKRASRFLSLKKRMGIERPVY